MNVFQKLLDKALILVFEKLPILSWINGHKRTIGDYLLIVAAALYAAQEQFPGVQGIETAVAVVGAALRWLGVAHADAKARSAR